jgi:hypothetical protein
VSANGRISSIVNTAISIPAGTSVYGNTGQITANSATGTVALGLATTAVTATTYGGTSGALNITVDQYGRITSAANVSGGGGVTIINDTATATALYPTFTATTSGSMTAANVSSTKLTFVPSTGTLSATIISSLSDENYKNTIITISDATDTINKIDGVSFNWNDTGKKSFGVIAQRLEEVLPELVETIDNKKTVNYSGLMGFMINAIKELNSEVNVLKEKVQELQQKK